MVRVREIPRTAAFAWSPGSASPWIATGTRAGAVDADFSNETCLELWDLALDDEASTSELQPKAKIETDSGFHDLAWTVTDDTKPRGIIAGALENGSLDLWNAQKLWDGASDPLISRQTKHSGAIKTLQFNPKHSNLLATGGAKGELYISDLNNISNPYRLGNTAARADDIECLDWNKKVAHILVTGSSGGFVTVWDVKAKKESLTLNNLGRKAVSAVAWDPEKPTKLITAVPLESDPLILVWDLRNSNAPERTLRGHESGVLSLSWCGQDNDLLLSCGKDNRTICWNPSTGDPYGEFPVVTNWTFQTRFNPHNPNYFATASFDGKIAIQTLQNTKASEAQANVAQAQPLDGEDFFAKAQTQPQAATFTLPKPPVWLKRPASVAFGFGGSVVSVGKTETGSTVKITKYEVDSGIGSATEDFEKALADGDLTKICESKLAQAKTDEEKAEWKVLETLLSSDSKQKLIEYLGVTSDVDAAAEGIAKLEVTPAEAEPTTDAAKKNNRLSSFFGDSGEADTFLSDLAASKDAKTNSPFQIYTGSESAADKKITTALMLGQFEQALDILLAEDRLSDAFVVARLGGEACLQKAQDAYFSKQKGGPNYVRLLAAVVGKNLWDVVHNADLENWKEVMATLCTFADDKEFPDLCETLGDRIMEQVSAGSGKDGRKDASFCYLVGSKLEKVVSIWLEQSQEEEKAAMAEAGTQSGFSIHVRALQNLIEKVTIFRQVTAFKDTETSKTSEWKLDALYKKYLEYADVVAAHGRLQIADKFLQLLPTSYPEADVARNRVKFATKKATPAAASASASRTAATKAAPTLATFQPAPSPFVPITGPPAPNVYPNPASNPTPVNMYAPPAAAATPSNPYASVGGGYTPAGYQAPQQMRGPGAVPPPQSYGVPPPPRTFNQSPSIPPPSRATNMTNWNDIPDDFAKPTTSRRGTPAAPAVYQNNFAPQAMPSRSTPPPPQSRGPPPRATPAPPPKGPAPPPRVSSPLTGGHSSFQAPERPSSVANAYAPPQPSQTPSTMSPPANQIPRGPSPFTAPPSGPPPVNRYAPSPATQAAAQPTAPPPQQSRPSVGPPPMASSYQAAPPANPYASQPPPAAAPSPYAPSAPPTSQPPPQAPPSSAAPPPRPDTATSQKKAAPAAPKYPAGDRTHIPPNALPIYELLSADMARVKARAPASFKAQVNDTEKRLNILFDHLNNEDLLKPDTVSMVAELAQAMQAKQYEQAQGIYQDLIVNKTEEGGNWMVGVKRLIGMSRATP